VETPESSYSEESVEYPPRSPDLTSLDVWGDLNNTCTQDKQEHFWTRGATLLLPVLLFHQQQCEKYAIVERPQQCIGTGGGNFEHS
jgi:hypothetical protein